MNRAVTQIKIKNAKDALDYYEKNIEMQIIKRYIAKKLGTAKSFQGKLVYGLVDVNGVEMILTEQEDDRVPEAKNVYMVMTDDAKNRKWLEKAFKNLKKDSKFVFTEPSWNASGTMYGSLQDKFGVFWEFKMERKEDE